MKGINNLCQNGRLANSVLLAKGKFGHIMPVKIQKL